MNEYIFFYLIIGYDTISFTVWFIELRDPF